MYTDQTNTSLSIQHQPADARNKQQNHIMSHIKQTFRTHCTTVFAALVSAAGLWCATPSAHAQAQVTTGSVLNVFAGGKITLGDTTNTQAFCNPAFYDSPKLNVVATNLPGTTQCKNAASATPAITALITASGSNASRMTLPAFLSTTNPLDVNYANGAQVIINNGSTSSTINGDGQLAVTSASQTLTLKTQAGVLNLPAGEYAKINLQVNKVLHFQAGAVPTRIKQLNLSNCNGTVMEFEPGEYYIENANWQQSCHLKVAAAGNGNSNTSVKLYFKNAFNLGSGPTCWNISGGTTCGNNMTPAQIASQTPDKLKVYLYSGNFTTAQGAQIAGGIYVDQGDITLTAANNFVFAGDLFAKNISISNGGPTSLLYKPVFTSITGPVTNLPTVSIAQPVPPAIQGVPANGNFIAPAAVTLTATATPATGSGNTISQVQFYQGSTLIGTAATPTVSNGNNYSVSWTNVTANSYSVTAKATDNKNGTTSTAPITVNVINNTPPTVSLTASPNNGTAPATIILNATAADTDGTISKVEFFNGATSIATVTQSPYKTNWENVSQGSYSVTAKATDNLGAMTTSTPVQVAVTKNVPKMYDIHTDHLNTPRVITDNTGTEVWRWDSAPFGETLPNEQPQNNVSKFVWNQRFPGQYYDEETGLHYNYFRDYDPQSGRYVQSDPIGLRGGINTYGYVAGNPIRFSDRFGLACPPALKASGRCIDADDYDPCKDGSGNTRGSSDENAKKNKNSVDLYPDKEAAGRVTNDGNFEIVPSTYVYTDDGITTTANYPNDGKTKDIIHSHPNADDWSNVPGPKDDGAVNSGYPNYIVRNDFIGVVEIVDGQYQFRIVSGRMNGKDRMSTREMLNKYRDRARAKSQCKCDSK
ncbi:MAG: hypothetical protein HY254_21555 [Burkholderiales bacterium]|nr:hypothetical protein [Burkholderiales bacterium]